MTILEALKYSKDLLKQNGKPEYEAEILLSHILNKDKIYLFCNLNKKLSSEDQNKFLEGINQRIKGRPLQYILGYWEFYGHKLIVKEGVLIPRPDTEILVERALNLIKNTKNPKIVDIGCGSGAISITLAKERDDAIVFALDIEDIPLEVTKQNAILNGVEERVSIIRSNLLSALGEKYFNSIDLIVSNPPYIKEDEIQTLMEEVRDYEPITALSGGEDGLYFYREITLQSRKYLKSGGFIAYEIGHNQGEDVKSILLQNSFDEVNIFKDFAGHDRVVVAKKA